MSIWQTKAWWDMLLASGQANEIFEINGIQVEKRQVSMWEYWLFVLWLEKQLSKKDVEKLIELCKKQKALFLQLEAIQYWDISKWDIVWIKKGYYKKFIMPYTAVIDLRKSEDEILASMKPKWRYNIKIARKNDIVVREVEKTDENIWEFYELIQQTTCRDNFSWNTKEFYTCFLRSLDHSKLLLAYKDHEVVAGGIFTFSKDVSIYYYGASTSQKQYRNMMAPYLLQWQAIEIAKEIWSELYDFLWVASPEDTNSSLAWVTDFKKKLTKDIRYVSDSYIYINKKLKYSIISFLKQIKHTIKK